MTYMEIKLMKCNNNSKKAYPAYANVTCKDKTFIDNYFESEVFNFAFINSLFDATDFINPVKTFIDDSLFFELDPTRAKKANFFIM